MMDSDELRKTLKEVIDEEFEDKSASKPWAWSLIAVFYLVISGLTFGYIHEIACKDCYEGNRGFSSVSGAIVWPLAIPMIVGLHVFKAGPQYERANSCQLPDTCYKQKQ